MPNLAIPQSSAQRPPSANAVKRGPYAKSKQTRARILNAASEVAGEVGLQRASVATIAERAGVAVGNLHYHFGSKDNLLNELMDWVQQDSLALVEEAFSETRHFFAGHEAFIRAYLSYVRQNPAYIRLAEEMRLHRPDRYKDGVATLLRLIQEGLTEGIEAGEVRPMTPETIANLAHFILGTRYFIDQMVECVDGRPYPGDDVVITTYLEFIQFGLTKREPS